MRILQIRLRPEEGITQEDIAMWLKVIAFAKKNQYGIMEIPIVAGKPTVGKWTPTICFTP